MAKVSILVNCKNGQKYLSKAIESILIQDHKDFEIIFVDNCSIDNSLNIVESFKDKRIKIISTKKDMQLGQARNFGMKHIDSDYLCFLDVDDRMLKNRIKNQLEIMESGKFGICYGSCNLVNSKEKIIGKINIKNSQGYLLENLLIGGNVPFCTSMIDVKSNFDDIYFNEEFKYAPDLEFLSRILINSKAVGSSNIFTNYMVRNDSLSADTIKYAHEERLLLIKNIENKINKELLFKYKNKADKTLILSSVLNKKLSLKNLIYNLRKENYKKRMIFLITIFHCLPFGFKNRLINTLKYRIPFLFLFRF